MPGFCWCGDAGTEHSSGKTLSCSFWAWAARGRLSSASLCSVCTLTALMSMPQFSELPTQASQPAAKLPDILQGVAGYYKPCHIRSGQGYPASLLWSPLNEQGFNWVIMLIVLTEWGAKSCSSLQLWPKPCFLSINLGVSKGQFLSPFLLELVFLFRACSPSPLSNQVPNIETAFFRLHPGHFGSLLAKPECITTPRLRSSIFWSI